MDIKLVEKIKKVFYLGYSESEIQDLLKITNECWFYLKEKYQLHTFFEEATHELALQKILDYENTRVPIQQINNYIKKKFENDELSFSQLLQLLNQHHPEFNQQLQMEKEKHKLTKKELEIKQMLAKHSMRTIDDKNKPIKVEFKEISLDLIDEDKKNDNKMLALTKGDTL